MTAFAPHRRRASVYIMTLGCALIVTIIGLSAALAVRVRLRSVQGGNDFIAARSYARSAVEIGLLTLLHQQDWRTELSNGVWFADTPVGRGSMTLSGIDPGDADLADDTGDSLVLTGTGTCGEARYHLQVTLVPPVEPLEALSTCLHAGGQILVHSDSVLSATGAPISTNGTLWSQGSVLGDVEAGSVSTLHPIVGEVTAPAPSKELPDADVFGEYAALATPVAFTGDIENVLLSPDSNPWGSTNANGVYLIDTGGADLGIQDTRVQGTLLIRTRGGTVYLDEDVFFGPARADYPTLIVDGNVNLALESEAVLLSPSKAILKQLKKLDKQQAEAKAEVEVDAEGEFIEPHQSELCGLVHITGNLTCEEDSRVRGTIICEGDFVCEEDSLELIYDPSLNDTPPQLYVTFGTPVVSAGSWRRNVPPILERELEPLPAKVD